MALDKIFGDSQFFLLGILSELKSLGITEAIHSDFTKLEIDHICYKPCTLELYEKHKKELENLATLLIEADINGRPIATYKLDIPLEVNGLFIPLFELPAPKKGMPKQSQYDHIEIVLRQESLHSFYERFPSLDWDISNIAAKMNPDIALKLKSGKVKFHPTSLEEVIAEEILLLP